MSPVRGHPTSRFRPQRRRLGGPTWPALAAAVAYGLVCGWLLSPTPTSAETLTVIGWNADADARDPEPLAELIAEAQNTDLWGVTEARKGWADRFAAAAEVGEDAPFEAIIGSTGGNKRSLVLYNNDYLEEVSTRELTTEVADETGGRAPLVAHFRIRSTGAEFLFLVSHLSASNAPRRHQQARRLKSWASRQTLPLIAVGRYNFAWRVNGGAKEHDFGYEHLTAGGHLQWVRPAVLLSTRCDPVARIQDFVFAGGDALQWNPVSEILYPEDEFCTKKPNRQEHRPVQAFFDLAYDAEEERTNEILERIDRLEEDLKALRELVTETEP